MADVGSIDRAKACKVLEDGTVNGEALTPAQIRFMGARCSGQPERAAHGALVINTALMDVLNETPNMQVPDEDE